MSGGTFAYVVNPEHVIGYAFLAAN